MPGLKQQPLTERIERHSIPEPNSGCWLWTGTIGPNGYGTMGIGGNRKLGGKTRGVHQVAWMAYRGEIPAGLFVCHHCDMKTCVNPDHLYVAPHAKNMEDAGSRKRMRFGKEHHAAILNRGLVIAFRDMARVGFTASQIAARFGFSRSNVRHVLTGYVWSHIP